jgi:hypothetical protein
MAALLAPRSRFNGRKKTVKLWYITPPPMHWIREPKRSIHQP